MTAEDALRSPVPRLNRRTRAGVKPIRHKSRTLDLGAIARPPRDGASFAMDLRDLPQSRPLVDRETVSFRSVAQSGSHALRRVCRQVRDELARRSALAGQGSRTKFEQEQSNVAALGRPAARRSEKFERLLKIS